MYSSHTRRELSHPDWLCLEAASGDLCGRAGELRHRTERRLCSVESEPEIPVREGRKDIDWLMPRRIPSGARVHAPLVLAQADRTDDVHEWCGVGTDHVMAHGGWMIGRVFLVGVPEEERELHGVVGAPGGGLELDVDVGFGPLLGIPGAVGVWHAVVPHHHVVLNHPE